jgi:hypothetical protein
MPGLGLMSGFTGACEKLDGFTSVFGNIEREFNAASPKRIRNKEDVVLVVLNQKNYGFVSAHEFAAAGN